LRRRTVRSSHAHGWFGIGLAGFRSPVQALSLQLLYPGRDRRCAGAAPKGTQGRRSRVRTIGRCYSDAPHDRGAAGPQASAADRLRGQVQRSLYGGIGPDRGSGLGLGIDDFTDELVRDATRRALMRRISVTSDPRCDAIFSQQAPAILSVTTKDGRRMVEEVLINRGSPERPLSDKELAVKFSENCRGVLAPATTPAPPSSIHP